MDQFPETFTPEILAKVAKLEIDKKTTEMKTLVDSTISGVRYEIGKNYIINVEKNYSVDEVNQIIKIIRDKIKVNNIYCVVQVMAFKDLILKRNGCGEYYAIWYSYHFNANQKVSKVKKLIRKEIVDKFNGEKCVIELDKYPTKDVIDIQQELMKLGWNVAIIKDHWDHIHDDYCVIDLELRIESDIVLIESKEKDECGD